MNIVGHRFNNISERGLTAQIMLNHIAYPQCQHLPALALASLKLRPAAGKYRRSTMSKYPVKATAAANHVPETPKPGRLVKRECMGKAATRKIRTENPGELCQYLTRQAQKPMPSHYPDVNDVLLTTPRNSQATTCPCWHSTCIRTKCCRTEQNGTERNVSTMAETSTT